MTSPTRPTFPDEDFASRYAQTYPYGFYMRMDDRESVDDIIDDKERWVILNINPRSVTWRDPASTSITPTQGGGKVIESRGGVLAYGQISGTTGYLPTNVKGGVPIIQAGGSRATLVPDDPDFDLRIGVLSGFYKFHVLRHLFRLYLHERRMGNTKVSMHYMDFKSEEFYRVEPTEFTMRRTAGRETYTYNYDISLTAIEPSDAVARPTIGALVRTLKLPTFENLMPMTLASIDFGQAQQNADALRQFTDSGTQKSVDRMRVLRDAGLGFVQHTSGSVQRRFQDALTQVGRVLQFFDNAHSALKTVLDLPVSLLTQARFALDAVINVAYSFAPSTIMEELNEWWLEMNGLIDGISATFLDALGASQDVQSTDRDFSRGAAKRGATTDLMTEPSGSLGSPDANPYIGTSGLGLVTDVDALASTSNLQAVPILDGDTIWSIAKRIFGDVARFIDLILLNRLSAPYIVRDAASKPSNTLAWGESIQVPAADVGSFVEPSDVSQNAPTYSNVATTAGGSATLIDTTLRDVPWRTNQWAGYTITLRPGTPTEERRVIVENTATVLTVNLNWSVPPANLDAYAITLIIFDAHRPATPDAKAYGRDFLLRFSRRDGNPLGQPMVSILFNARGDIASAVGMDNFIQAMQLRGVTEQGRHTFHKSFGLGLPVGRPFTPSNKLMYTYFARRSFLLDPRVARVQKMSLTQSGSDTFTLYAEIQPAQSRRTRPVSITR